MKKHLTLKQMKVVEQALLQANQDRLYRDPTYDDARYKKYLIAKMWRTGKI